MLAFGICCSQYIPPLKDKVPNPLHNLCISLSLYLAICFCAPLAPAHFNPSVSLGACFGTKPQKNRIRTMFLYWAAQFLGAFLGLLAGYLIYDSVVGPFDDGPIVTDLASQFVG
jgi:glycerol uptake facilitator-like aquaporin